MKYLILFISLFLIGCGSDSNTSNSRGNIPGNSPINTASANNTLSANCNVTECVKSQVRAMSCEAIKSMGRSFDSNAQKTCYQQCQANKTPFNRREMLEETKQRCL